MPFSTLRKIIDGGHQVGAYCKTECGWSEYLDLQVLAEHVDPDRKMLLAELNPRLRCKRCGRFTVTTRLHPKYSSIEKMDIHGRIGDAIDKPRRNEKAAPGEERG